MRHRAPRHLALLKPLRLFRGSRYLLAGRRRAGWLITNQKIRVSLAMASIMVLACAAFVAATEIPDDDSVAATDVPRAAGQPLRSGASEQVSRSSGRAPLDLPDGSPTQGSPTQGSPDRQAPAPAPDSPRADSGAGVPSPDQEEDEPATSGGPAAVASPGSPSQTPAAPDPGAGLDVSSPPTLEVPMGAPTGSSDDPESPTEETGDESSEWGDGDYDEPTEKASPTPTSADQTAPETEIVSSPTAGDDALAASAFEFTANESATFKCSLDGQPFVPCGSPTEYDDLGPGWHTFAVQATDAAGNVDASPAQQSWLATGGDSAPLLGEVSPSEDSLVP